MRDYFCEEIPAQFQSKKLLEFAKNSAYGYMDALPVKRIYPSEEDLRLLAHFDEPLSQQGHSAEDVLRMLDAYGAKNAVTQIGGRYFGFVNGGALPVGLAARWMADAWDQNCVMQVASPIGAKLEAVVEGWLCDLLSLPEGTAAGFVTGSSNASLCALTAARNAILRGHGWNVHKSGLFGAPAVQVVLGEQAHASIFKALAMLGIGEAQIRRVKNDSQGRIIPEEVGALNSSTILILQAGNVNSGAFDPLDAIIPQAKAQGAWVHVDGAFGLWAAACSQTRHLTKGLEGADSWSCDAHKTLNVPYDSGILLVRDRAALTASLTAAGDYLPVGAEREPMHYSAEMSKRARSIELWATLRYLGKSGVDALIKRLCAHARLFGARFAAEGFEVLNEIAFNQVLIRCGSDALTMAVLKTVQQSGVCWCGQSLWENRPVIRVSVSSWGTTEEDVSKSVQAFVDARRQNAGLE